MKLFRKRKQNTLTPAQVVFVRKVYEDCACTYCGKIRSAVSEWCGSEEAIAVRHTAIPGIIHCSFWAPDKAFIRAKLKGLKNKAEK